jgi:GNAT superfamily N-acetyltransferase
MMAISIRLAEAEDADQLHGMIKDLARYEREEHSVKVTAADLRQQLSDANPPFECAIAEIDGKAAGFALYFYAYSTWEGTRTLYLEDLYVSPEFRGAGVGVALMVFLAQTAHQGNCRRFEWSVLDWNESAVGFYQNLGAKPLIGWTRYRMDAQAIEAFMNGASQIVPTANVA